MKTAEELNVTADELDALVRVRDLLASGKIEHGNTEGLPPELLTTDTNLFSMNYTAQNTDGCGSVCCIGGWMYAITHGEADQAGILRFDRDAARDYVDEHQTLGDLFYPSAEGMNFDYDNITIAQAVAAIDNLLATGKPNWGSILEVDED